MSEERFKGSAELKTLFNNELGKWRKTHAEGLDELGRLCGVSASYLSQISRYGRVPGRPVLILLALNFNMSSPERLFAAAELDEPWPLERNLSLAPRGESDPGLLSVKLDMSGFTDAIRTIVKEETRPKTIAELTRGRPLRLGINKNDPWLFKNPDKQTTDNFIEPLNAFCEQLSIALQCRISIELVDFADLGVRFESGDLDIFGPLGDGPYSSAGTFTMPFCQIGVSALIRKRPSSYLPQLDPPRTIEDLLSRPYVITVVRDQTAHLFASTRLKRSDSELIVCDSLTECYERITLSSVAKGAHVMLCNSANALAIQKQYPEEVLSAFLDSESLLKVQDTVFSIRPDWPELVTVFNTALSYLLRTGGLAEKFTPWIEQTANGLVWLPEVR